MIQMLMDLSMLPIVMLMSQSPHAQKQILLVPFKPKRNANPSSAKRNTSNELYKITHCTRDQTCTGKKNHKERMKSIVGHLCHEEIRWQQHSWQLRKTSKPLRVPPITLGLTQSLSVFIGLSESSPYSVGLIQLSPRFKPSTVDI